MTEPHRREVLGFLAAGAISAGVGTARADVSPQFPAEADAVWTYDTQDRVTGSPTVVDGTVYVLNVGEGLVGLDADRGSLRWRREITFGTASSPAVIGGVAYVVTVFGSVLAIDLRTGETNWESESADEYNYRGRVTPSPLVVDGTVYVGKSDGTLYAYDAKSGDIEWEFQTDGEIAASAVSHEGSVFVPTQAGTLYAVDAESGTEDWAVGIDGAGYSSPTFADGTLYVGSESGSVHALDPETGATEWTADRDGEVTSTPTVADGTVFVGDSDTDRVPELVALDAESGEITWEGEEGMVWSSPTVAGDRVYISGTYLTGYDIESGDWELIFTDPTPNYDSSPTVVDGTLYVGGENGIVCAVETGTDATSRGSRIEEGTFGHLGSYPGAAGVEQFGATTRDGSQPDGGGDGGDAGGAGAASGGAGSQPGDSGTSLLLAIILGAAASLLGLRYLLGGDGEPGGGR